MRAINHRSVKLGIATFVTVALFCISISHTVEAQNSTLFNPTDSFIISHQNSSIRFATNGSYSSATLQDGTWLFKDLTLYNSTRSNDLKISASNSNVLIYTYSASSPYSQFSRFAIIIFSVEGLGTQEFNLCLNNSQPTHPSEWGVVLPDGTFLAEGKNWQLSTDDTILISGLTGNVALVHYGFDASEKGDLPFYEEHSVALVTLAVVAITIIISSIINYKVQRSQYGH